MRWEDEAAKRLERVPFFVRGKVKRKVEEFVASRGRDVVASEDVSEARRTLAGSGDPEIRIKGARGSLGEEELRRIEEIVERGVEVEGGNTRYHRLKLCGGAAGCPFSLVDDGALGRRVAAAVSAGGLDGFIAGRVDGPVLLHEKFRMAVAGCPNGCSQPQIQDFALTARRFPAVGDARCTGCRLCVRVCREGAVELRDDAGGGAAGPRPVLRLDRCVGCGDCVEVCSTKALCLGRQGLEVTAGGRLGRRPFLGVTISDLATEEEACALLRGCVEVFRALGRDGERFSTLVERLGAGGLLAEIGRYGNSLADAAIR